MNSIRKLNNANVARNTATNASSFIAAPMNNMKNMAVNVSNTVSNAANSASNALSNAANSASNAVTNSFKTNLPSLYEPINDSIEFAKENSDSPFVSVTVA